MKKNIALLFLALASVTVNAEEISKNSSTGMVLDETAGVYSLVGKHGGVIILGDIKTARDFLFSANVCFAQEKLQSLVDCGEQKFKVEKDDDGLYIIKIGIGGVKVRPSNSAKFFAILEGKIAKEKAGKIWDVITE